MWLNILLLLLTGLCSNYEKAFRAHCEKLGSDIFLLNLVIYSSDFSSIAGRIWIILFSGSTLDINSNFLVFLFPGEVYSLIYEGFFF